MSGMRVTRILLSLALLALVSCKKDSGFDNNPDIPDWLHNRPVGASAREILSSMTYTSVVVEVQFMTGNAPDASAMSHLQQFLETISSKPDGVTITTREIPVASGAVLTTDDVIRIEQKYRTKFTAGKQLALYLLYTNGNFSDPNVLGIAYRNTSVALFGGNIQANSGGLGQASRTKLVATVAEHEMGHLAGLTDLGSPMQTFHKDAAHGNHCDNQSCLMYYASETRDILGFLVTGSIPALDANCRADLQANGGR